MKKKKSRMPFAAAWLAAMLLFTTQAFAAPTAGNVSTAIESTWKSAAAQIKTVTNNVIFPIVDCVLVIMLFVKLALLYFDYKKHGEVEFMPAAILFFGLLFSLTAPLYVWTVIGV